MASTPRGPEPVGLGLSDDLGVVRAVLQGAGQQLLPKPPVLSWVHSSAYGVTYFTAYRMLIDQCDLQAGQNVLIWGGAGGLGVFAAQLCRAAGRMPWRSLVCREG